jgi:tetratricopeptide (TPR) repeat protein
MMKNGVFNRPFIHLVLVALLGLLAYSNTFNVPFTFDDFQNIDENPIIKDLNHFAEPSTAEGYPKYAVLKSRYVGYLTFAFNYRAHGLDVRGYHAVNLAVHIANALLVYWLVLLTFRTPFLKDSRLMEYSGHIALFSALLFVAHPVQTQAVTYIVQRLASLATLFYLLSLALYIRFRFMDIPSPKSVSLYALSLISAVLAMKTKEIAFTLPVMVALYEFLFFEGSLKKRILYVLPLALTMLIIPLTLLGADRPPGEIIGGVGEATRLATEMPRADYLFTQFRVIATYIRLMFLPVNQNLDYDYPVFNSLLTPQVILSFVFLVSVFGIGIYLTYSSRKRDAALRVVAFGIFWFFITLSVESSVIPIRDVIFEHRLYLPGTGVFMAAAAGAALLMKSLKKERATIGATVLLLLVPVLLASAMYVRNGVWRSELSLWEDVVSKSSGNWRGQYNLGNALRDGGAIDKSMEHYLAAIRLNPGKARPHNNLGIAYKKKGWIEKAVEQYEMAIKADPFYANAYNNLGNIYIARGMYDKAIGYYETALSLDPNYTDANYNMGVTYHHKGQTDEAMRYYAIALELNPDYADAHYNLGLAYLEKGDVGMAQAQFEKVLQIEPTYKKAMEKLNELRGSLQPENIE